MGKKWYYFIESIGIMIVIYFLILKFIICKYKFIEILILIRILFILKLFLICEW